MTWYWFSLWDWWRPMRYTTGCAQGDHTFFPFFLQCFLNITLEKVIYVLSNKELNYTFFTNFSVRPKKESGVINIHHWKNLPKFTCAAVYESFYTGLPWPNGGPMQDLKVGAPIIPQPPTLLWIFTTTTKCHLILSDYRCHYLSFTLLIVRLILHTGAHQLLNCTIYTYRS